ncbi:MAG TPA: NAD(P)-dependent oxidoreductase [Candidatus Eisenbacteria bacterium]|nr:NAD(P)-dependent oxidoreductase [Candidatus Eisenbacteria bacterium]
MTTVAIVGTGRMGSAMARAIARAGFHLVVHNRTRERATALAAELGARVADSPREAAASADVTITMLADDTAVAAAFDGPNGLLAGAHDGCVLVDMSTVRPDTLAAFEGRARAVGAGLLDAPVSGSVHLAEAGTLTLMVGGEAADLERARPVLEAVSNTIIHLGPVGTGAAMKLAVNTVIFGLNGALAEALVLAEASGIDRATAYDVIAASAAGAPFVGYKRAAFVDPEGTPVAFSLDLTDKDLGLIAGVAETLGVAMPQAAVNRALVRRASANGRGSNDFATVAGELRSGRSFAGSPREGAPT